MSKDGGPAFPAQPTQYFDNAISITMPHGMTLRDYFATAALKGMLANSENAFIPSQDQFKQGITWANLAAKDSYELADAMLKERDK